MNWCCLNSYLEEEKKLNWKVVFHQSFRWKLKVKKADEQFEYEKVSELYFCSSHKAREVH